MAAQTDPPQSLHDVSLEQRYLTAIARAARVWRRVFAQVAHEFGLTEATIMPLLYLTRISPAPRQAALAELMDVQGASVVPLLDHLVEAGFVQRIEDPLDKRARLLRLTPKGLKAARKINRQLSIRAEAFMQSARTADIEAGLRSLLSADVGLRALLSTDDRAN
jgi:MarR family transcriptional regulator for hemolysin